VGFPSSARPRIPVTAQVRPKPRPALFGVHSRIPGRSRPKPVHSATQALPRQRRSRSRSGDTLSHREGQALFGFPAIEIGATTWVTRHFDKGGSVSGSQRPGMPPTLYWSPVSADPRATHCTVTQQGRRVPPAHLREEGRETEGDAGPARPPGGELAEARSLWSQSFGTRRKPERLALLRALAARKPGSKNHLGSIYWLFLGRQRPRLSRGPCDGFSVPTPLWRSGFRMNAAS
jgi:hypothetical protein